MARHPSSQPTEVELQILHVLWEQGPCTVRAVHNQLAEAKTTSYATTVKMLAVMLDKGLVKRDDSVRPLVYRAAASQQRTQRRMLDDLIRKVYDGSAASVVLQLLTDNKTSAEDLKQIKQLIDQLEQDS